MAPSPSHKFGQEVGCLIEAAIRPRLLTMTEKHGLYLDYEGRERQARSGTKVRWEDDYGNKHNLDYVIESEGSDTQIGNPIAFVECAWRRATKHSKNKAQEIQGAILPVAEKHGHTRPFLGAIVAGDFTSDSLTQLKSLGFWVAHFPLGTVRDVFRGAGLEIEFSDNTPDEEWQRGVEWFARKSSRERDELGRLILSQNRRQIDIFLRELDRYVTRRMTRITITPLYGNATKFDSAVNALSFLETQAESSERGEFQRFEIVVNFSNGDTIECGFREQARAKEFVERYLSEDRV